CPVPPTTTSTVRHTPSNAARGSLASNLTTVASSSAAVAADKDARTFECLVMGSSFVSGGWMVSRSTRMSSLQRRSHALKRHQASAPNGAPLRYAVDDE